MTAMPYGVSVRDIGPADATSLLEMFLLSMNWRGPQVWTLDAALRDLHVGRYIERWGKRQGDSGLVAVDDADHVIGATWIRQFTAEEPGYGYVADDIPELGLAVAEHVRGRGVGRTLLTALLSQCQADGIPGVSLSVEDGNDAARHVYLRAGFVTVGREGDSTTTRQTRRT
jgi:ribosomal protein S18 acetylase RimI-like enzyme